MSNTVLIVEDYEDARVMMKVLVELCGYKAIEAEDGYEAIEKVKEFSPQLIFMDLSMPRLDGIAATAEIRSLGEYADTPIIALTAYGDLHGQEAIEAGCNEVIPKPMDFERLQPLLDKYMASASSSTNSLL
jgi:CheY-like chemotaxis protein